ncbi:MAG: hypothetical protein HYT49_03750 [Candidatus Wildermuthbacteria bacterium]|nr:hypothetical protein [Candidatus Wildermuthbacteria bacterium]
MHLILIPLLIITALVGIYEGGDIWKSFDFSVPSLGEDGLNVRQFFGAPVSPNSPLHKLGN